MVYDEDGRLEKVHVEREPEWTPDQVALVLGVEAYESLIGPHGQPMDEAMSVESDPSNREGKRIYRAGVAVKTPEGQTVYAPLRDWAQKAKDDAAEAYKKAAGNDANLNGLVWPITVEERTRG